MTKESDFDSIYSKRNAKKPNVLLIMADDMGYSDSECYGGEVATPNLAKLAANGSGKKEYAEWELYDLKTDRSEMNDLALKYPDKVIELDRRWNRIAEDFRKGLKMK